MSENHTGTDKKSVEAEQNKEEVEQRQADIEDRKDRLDTDDEPIS